jgi:hypothetical protein
MNGTRVPNATIRDAGTAAFKRTGSDLAAPRKQRLLATACDLGSSSQGDITPEFSGRAPRSKRTNAVLNADTTVMRVHFIDPGPAATRCYIAARTTPHRRWTPIAWRSVRSASRRISESPFHVHGPIMRPRRQRRNNTEASWHERHEGAECHKSRGGHGRFQANRQRPCRAAEATPSFHCACLGVFKPRRYNARVQRADDEAQGHYRRTPT